jgi:transcription initiation factor TFIIH subunit 1
MTEFDDASNGTTSCAADTSNYPQVRFKELEGSLVLTREQIAFSTTTTSSSIQPSWSIAWLQVLKHQVSPVTYPKCLLKLVLKEKGNVTFQLANRAELERIRRDITGRLQYARTAQNGSSAENNENVTNNHVAGPSRKRPHSQTISANIPGFGDLDATALAVTRSSLLAANPTLRAQHRYLVEETETVSEDDFWETHQDLLEEEFARIAGTLKPGMSSLLQSHLPLQGRVTLGVEEMRQIFILYPAVHKAYEEQVPFKLSDEQFWRNYLASQVRTLD